MNALTQFFSPEAGQARRNWLNAKLRPVENALNYYLGPTGIPNRVQGAANALEFTDAGDAVAAADASRRLWDNPTLGNAAEYAAAGIALGLPMYSARLGEGIADAVEAGVRAYDPNTTAINFGGIQDKYPGVKLSGSGNADRGYTLNRIEVPAAQRGEGVGSSVMGDILREADAEGATVALTPSSDFGGNKARLKDFYKRFGFVDNKGRNRDFEISEDMYRTAQPPQLTPAQTEAQGILDLLKQGRGSEVTDDMMAAADDLYLFENYDLPMDEASRMARAREVGFDADAYHATRYEGDIDNFRPGWRGSTYFAQTPEGALKGAAGSALETQQNLGGSRSIYPVMVRSGDVKGLSLNKAAFDELPEKLADAEWSDWVERGREAGLDWLEDAYLSVRNKDGSFTHYKDTPSLTKYSDIEPGLDALGYRLAGFNSGSDAGSLDRARKSGKSGFLVADEGGSSIVAGPDMPLRSRFARFDPRLKHLRNLSAGVAGTAVISQQERDEIEAFIAEHGG